MEKEITQISFPNTVQSCDRDFFRSDRHFFKIIKKNGEMAEVNWIEIWEGNEKEGCFKTKVAEIKESVCDIWFK
jgi:hypothetical protein